jgi:hypothetical protein
MWLQSSGSNHKKSSSDHKRNHKRRWIIYFCVCRIHHVLILIYNLSHNNIDAELDEEATTGKIYIYIGEWWLINNNSLLIIILSTINGTGIRHSRSITHYLRHRRPCHACVFLGRLRIKLICSRHWCWESAHSE